MLKFWLKCRVTMIGTPAPQGEGAEDDDDAIMTGVVDALAAPAPEERVARRRRPRVVARVGAFWS